MAKKRMSALEKKMDRLCFNFDNTCSLCGKRGYIIDPFNKLCVYCKNDTIVGVPGEVLESLDVPMTISEEEKAIDLVTENKSSAGVVKTI